MFRPMITRIHTGAVTVQNVEKMVEITIVACLSLEA